MLSSSTLCLIPPTLRIFYFFISYPSILIMTVMIKIILTLSSCTKPCPPPVVALHLLIAATLAPMMTRIL